MEQQVACLCILLLSYDLTHLPSETCEMSKKRQFSLASVLFLIPHQPHTAATAFVGGDGVIEETVAETDDYGLKPVMTSF
ncbi:MAG: hypothetical protein IJQ11_12060 [Bacteroidales bacterium]|nr:hypothetical protein [Bacteroidales bacterium]